MVTVEGDSGEDCTQAPLLGNWVFPGRQYVGTGISGVLLEFKV